MVGWIVGATVVLILLLAIAGLVFGFLLMLVDSDLVDEDEDDGSSLD